jgi:nitroreductase/FMN reductase (NADPH)/FMN reductase [NAD(P)H]
MNETIKQLFERKSVRVFEDKHIGEEDRRLILESATMAPSAGNQQLYTIIDITDDALKEKLAQTCDHQPFIAQADMVLVFCADCRKWVQAFREAGCVPRQPGAGDLLLAVTDTAIAAQNAVVAAQSMGIGSCYIGDILENAELHRDMLHLPAYVVPAVMLVFGYPTKQQRERKKPERVELKYIVHENSYQPTEGEQLRCMFAQKTGNQTYEEWMKAFCERKYNSDFSREMTRSVEVYLKDFMNCLTTDKSV